MKVSDIELVSDLYMMKRGRTPHKISFKGFSGLMGRSRLRAALFCKKLEIPLARSRTVRFTRAPRAPKQNQVTIAVELNIHILVG